MSKVAEGLRPEDYLNRPPVDERFVRRDVIDMRDQIRCFLAAYPELEGDDVLRADTLEGELDLDVVLTRIVLAAQNRKALAAGARALKQDLDARIARNDAAAERMEELALSLLRAANLQKRVLAIATLSVRRGSASVAIIDAVAIPQGFYETKRVERKAEIKKALLTGADVPGAELVYGEESLGVRFT